MSAAVSLREVSCVFRSGGKAVVAVDRVSLDFQPGEFFTLLGPSGSGKTTCLRMIGGFALPTSGSISIHGQDVSQLPPYNRPVNTVFQDYALFPHMSVLDNVAYSLMVRGVERSARERRAMALLETVQLPDVALRRPAQLSGGQRQRVALARALINEPKVLLLDEPLGALDLKLREQMQIELKTLQRKLGITFIFVTHDQHEALSMSDRIGVFNKGRLEQIASPDDLYNRPATRFVADFVGTANILPAGNLTASMIRPEQITLQTSTASGDEADAPVRLQGVVQDVQFFGSFWRVSVQPQSSSSTSQEPVLVDVPVASRTAPPARGDYARLFWDASAAHPISTVSDAPA